MSHPHTRRWTLSFKHACLNQSVCPDQCNLCACNPDKRCEHAGEFAPKHVEKCKLTTRCEAPLQIALCGAEESQEGSEAGPSTYIVGPDASSPNHFYLAFSLVMAVDSGVDEQGAGGILPIDAVRANEVLMTVMTDKEPEQQLLKRDTLNAGDTEDRRVRADFPDGRDCVTIDVQVTKGTESRLGGASHKYKLLAVLMTKADDQPVAYILSNSFLVTTKRAKSSWNTDVPLWSGPVSKLKHCGEQITKNLKDVRQCALHKGGSVPADCINTVETVEEFLQLYESIKNCSLVSKTLKNGLTPEATVEHAKTMLGRDDRMRLFVLAEARHGAMFACTQAKVNVVGGSPSVLLSYTPFRDIMRITLAEYRSTEQMRLMAELKEVATAAWNQEHHPSWYAAGLDSQPLLDHLKALLNQQGTGGDLELPLEQFAHMLQLPAFIFRPKTMQDAVAGSEAGPSSAQQSPPLWSSQPLAPQPAAGSPELQLDPSWAGSGQQQSRSFSEEALAASNGSPDPGLFLPAPPGLPLAALPEPFPAANPGHLSGTLAGPALADRQHSSDNWGAQQQAARQASFDLSQFDIRSESPPDVPEHFEPGFSGLSGPANVEQVVDRLRAAGARSPLIRPAYRDSQAWGYHTEAWSSDDLGYNTGQMLMPATSAPAQLRQVSPASGHSVTEYGPAGNPVMTHILHGQGQGQGQSLHSPQQVPQEQPLQQGFRPAARQVPKGFRTSSLVLPGRVTSGAHVRGLGHTQSDKSSDKTGRRTRSDNGLTQEQPGRKRHNSDSTAIVISNPTDTHGRDTWGHITQWGGSPFSQPQSQSLAADSQAAAWSFNTMPHSRHLSLGDFPSNFTFHGRPQQFVPDPIVRPIQQHTFVLPQSDGAGDQSSDEISFGHRIVSQSDLMSCLAAAQAGLDSSDDADSQQGTGQGTGQNQVLVLQPQVQHVVIIFLAKMRALVVRRRLQQGAATSTVLDQRLRQRAVLARWAKSMRIGRSSALDDVRSVSMSLSRHNSGELGLWETEQSDSDDQNLLTMAADFLGIDHLMHEEPDFDNLLN